jgi:hypothetical protein
MGLELSPEEVSVPRLSPECGPQHATEDAVLLGTVLMSQFVPSTTRDRKSAEDSKRLKQR